MNTFFDYYVMLNYVVYKFYRRNEKKEIDARLSSYLLSSLYLWLPFLCIDGFICIISAEFQLMTRQENRWLYIIPSVIVAIINYMLLYRGGRYRDEFQKLDKISDTEVFVKRKRNTKIFIIAIIVIVVIELSVVSYVNKYRF